MIDLVTIALLAIVFFVAYLLGGVTGFSMGKQEAYENAK